MFSDVLVEKRRNPSVEESLGLIYHQMIDLDKRMDEMASKINTLEKEVSDACLIRQTLEQHLADTKEMIEAFKGMRVFWRAILGIASATAVVIGAYEAVKRIFPLAKLQ